MRPLTTLKLMCKHKWLNRRYLGIDVKVCAKCAKEVKR